MRDKPISLGDLVQVVRSCCIGFVDDTPMFVVVEMYVEREVYSCEECRKELPLGTYALHRPNTGGIPVGWLKRIPPLEELDDVKRDEEITA